MNRSRSRFVSTTMTSASMPAAIHAAFEPAMPAPSTNTLAGRTPETPPIRIPRPPYSFSNRCAATCGAIRPAISLIGASSGRRPSGSCTVSYATAATFRSTSAWVSSWLGREVEVREQDLTLAQVLELRGDRLLDLHDHVGARPDLGRRRDDLGAGALVALLGDARTRSGAVLDQDLVPGRR